MSPLLSSLESVLTRFFSLFLIAALGVGLIFPWICDALAPFILPILMAVIYLGFLKTDYSVFQHEIRNVKRQLWLSTFCLILLPSFLFLVVKVLETLMGTNPAWGTGVLLLFASPVAALSPTLALVLNGHFERTLCTLILSSILAPFTLPLLLSFWVGESMDVHPLNMTLFLVQLILLPFVVAQLTLRFAKPVAKNLKPHTASISVLLLMLVIFGAISGLSENISSHPKEVLEGIAVASLCIFFSFCIGWLLHPPGVSLRDRSTLAILATWTNIGLSIVFAKQFFPDSPVLLFVILAEVPWNLSFAPAQFFIQKISGEPES